MAIGADGIRLSNDALAKWLIEDAPFRIQPAQFLPFIPVDGDSLRYASAAALPLAVPITFNVDMADQTTIPIATSRVGQFGEIATEFRVAYSTIDRMTNVNDQIAVQMAMAVRRLLYEYWTLFEQGNVATPGNFDGLIQMENPAKVIDKVGLAPTLNDLDALLGLITTNDGYTAFLITNRPMYQKLRALHYTAGFLPQHCRRMISYPTGPQERDFLCFDGVPILVLDFLEVPVASQTSIWAVVLGPNALHGIVPSSTGRSMFVTRSTIEEAGTKVIYHVTMPAGLALGSLCGLARIKNALWT